VQLDLKRIPSLLIFNKTDLLKPEESAALERGMGGIAISATHPPTLSVLIERIDQIIWPRSSSLETLSFDLSLR